MPHSGGLQLLVSAMVCALEAINVVVTAATTTSYLLFAFISALQSHQPVVLLHTA